MRSAEEYRVRLAASGVVWNNQGYVSIRDIQMGMFGGRELATSFQLDRPQQLHTPDFAMMAKSFGVASHTVTLAAAGLSL